MCLVFIVILQVPALLEALCDMQPHGPASRTSGILSLVNSLRDLIAGAIN